MGAPWVLPPHPPHPNCTPRGSGVGPNAPPVRPRRRNKPGPAARLGGTVTHGAGILPGKPLVPSSGAAKADGKKFKKIKKKRKKGKKLGKIGRGGGGFGLRGLYRSNRLRSESPAGVARNSPAAATAAAPRPVSPAAASRRGRCPQPRRAGVGVWGATSPPPKKPPRPPSPPRRVPLPPLRDGGGAEAAAVGQAPNPPPAPQKTLGGGGGCWEPFAPPPAGLGVWGLSGLRSLLGCARSAPSFPSAPWAFWNGGGGGGVGVSPPPTGVG